MVDDDHTGIEAVLTQINAARRPLEGPVAILLLRDHPRLALADAIRAGDGTTNGARVDACRARLVKDDRDRENAVGGQRDLLRPSPMLWEGLGTVDR